MKRKVLLVLALSLAVLSSVFASGKKDSSAESKIQLTFWNLSERQPGFDKVIEAFNAENPDIQVKGAYYDTDGIKDACKVAASANTLPDIWFNWGGSLGGFYAENNKVYDLTKYAADHNWKNIFSPGVLSLCTLSGKLAGYPTSYNVLDVYYRKDIFQKYNIAVPTTFDEFEKVCATLKSNGITPISTAGLYGWHVMRFVELLIEHYSGAALHDQMSAFQKSYNDPTVVQALTKYKEFVDKGYLPAGFVTADPNNTYMEVFAGTAAMDIQGQWYDGTILRNGQDMSKFGSFPFPSGGTNRLSAFAEMAQLNANLTPQRLDAAIKFLDYLYSKANVAKYAEYYNLPLPRLDAEMPSGQPNVAVMLAASNKNGTFTITDQAFPTEVADELFRVQDGIANNQITPANGAARIQAAIESYRSK